MTAARGSRPPASRARANARTRKSGALAATLTTANGSAVLHPLPVAQWRESVRYAISEGDTRLWASKVLPAKEYERWRELDPTMQEVLDFVHALNDNAGEDPGE